MASIVIMPGGFHPFHAGHYALYRSALKAFPNSEVFVAATDDTKKRPFPFAIKEKLAKVAGVQDGHFIQVKSPFQAKEITQRFDPEKDTLIFVRSEKDRTEQPIPGGTKKDGTPAYFQPYTGKNLQPFSKHAYIAYLPTVEFGPGIKSATEIRNIWPKLDERRKLAMVMSLYPKAQKNKRLAQNIIKLLDLGMGTEEDMKINEVANKLYSSRDIDIEQELGNGYVLVSEIDRSPDVVKHGYSLYHEEGPDQYRYVGTLRLSSYRTTDSEVNSEIKRLINKDRSTMTEAEDKEEKRGMSGVERAYFDPDTHSIMSYARQHYPEEPDLQAAFVKFVLRSLKHSKDSDERQDDELGHIVKKVKDLENKIDNMKKVKESLDYLEEK